MWWRSRPLVLQCVDRFLSEIPLLRLHSQSQHVPLYGGLQQHMQEPWHLRALRRWLLYVQDLLQSSQVRLSRSMQELQLHCWWGLQAKGGRLWRQRTVREEIRTVLRWVLVSNADSVRLTVQVRSEDGLQRMSSLLMLRRIDLTSIEQHRKWRVYQNERIILKDFAILWSTWIFLKSSLKWRLHRRCFYGCSKVKTALNKCLLWFNKSAAYFILAYLRYHSNCLCKLLNEWI